MTASAALPVAGGRPDGRAEDIEAPGDPLPEHYIETQTSLVERALRNLKHNEAFAVLDSYGDLGTIPNTPEGLFFRDTRYLSAFEMRLDGTRPLLLGSVIQDDNASLSVDLANADIHRDGEVVIPRDLIAISRTKLLWNQSCYERIGLYNFDDGPRAFRLSFRFDADFSDLFEVRGSKRERRGRRTSRVIGADRIEYRYVGLDEVERTTELCFTPPPARLAVGSAEYDVALDPHGRHSIAVTVTCHEGSGRYRVKSRPTFASAYREARRDLRATTQGIATVESSNDLFNEVACRATSDIYMLVTQFSSGPYPAAGIPWFSTVFGRDGIITAMMMLWIDPRIARGVLRYLAETQAQEIDPAADAQPGKILHECRYGEMANLGEVPFGHYYGTIDATPLFVMLAGMYFDRTGDRDTLKAIWPAIEAALSWCDTYGDRDGDGFVEYARETEKGLANQGWKDSQDSIFHADGRLADGPIALCEVQGYVYAAKRAAARLASVLGADTVAGRLAIEAEALKRRFQDAFWCDEIGTYALALDGEKKPCRVRSSNAGHALFTGIADPDRARRVARALTGPEGSSGWGVRTIARGEARYNPMSYHNGSVWPHDNTLIVMGLARYGLKGEAAGVFSDMFAAACYQDLRRLPELFCGFVRRPRRGPTSYPVACAPQAWAAASPFGMLQACLGLQLDSAQNEIGFNEPLMPDFLEDVIIRGLTLGETRVDARLQRTGNDVTVSILKREGDARIVQQK